jgi:hypothetical protein
MPGWRVPQRFPSLRSHARACFLVLGPEDSPPRAVRATLAQLNDSPDSSRPLPACRPTVLRSAPPGRSLRPARPATTTRRLVPKLAPVARGQADATAAWRSKLFRSRAAFAAPTQTENSAGFLRTAAIAHPRRSRSSRQVDPVRIPAPAGPSPLDRVEVASASLGHPRWSASRMLPSVPLVFSLVRRTCRAPVDALGRSN